MSYQVNKRGFGFYGMLSVTFLFVTQICQEPRYGFAPNSKGGRVWSLARTSLNVKVKDQGRQGQKTRLAVPSPPGSMQMACVRCKQRTAAVDSTIASLPGGDFGGLRAAYAW